MVRTWMRAILASALALALTPVAAFAYTPGQEVPIPFPKRYLPFDTPYVNFTPTGGQVLVSNAPETINENGAKRADGSEITGQYNAALYRDTVTGPFRFWASHYNKTTHKLKFWLHVKNVSGEPIRFYKTMEAYDDANVTAAASNVTKRFMNAEPNPALLATIPADGSYYFAISDADHVSIGESMVYLAEFNAVAEDDGASANVLMSHVVTTDSVNDPTPYAATATIARTNATADRSDDYRGLLAHWGRAGAVNLTLTDANPFTGLRISDLGYSGEQEKLMTRWDVLGNPVEQREVRFITPTVNKLRLAYWYTDYNVDVNITNETRYPIVHTLYGSNGSNPGFVNYQVNGAPALNYHFSTNTVVPVASTGTYRLRTMVMPSASLPLGLFFAAGSPDAVPNELAVVQAETTALQSHADQARTTVNAMADSADKTALLQRLAALQAVIAASGKMPAAEQAAAAFEQTLQQADLSIGNPKERERTLAGLRTELQKVRDLRENVQSLIVALPASDQPVVQGHIDSLAKRSARINGIVQSLQAILTEAEDPMRQGNGTLPRFKAERGATVDLGEMAADVVGTAPAIRWISFDSAIASIDPEGRLTGNRNGVVKIAAYDDLGVHYVIVVVHH
ncbi:hypothetical protein FE784_04000 [Paenibacillus hemerocallicola]|uniref:BIG2 domain-containing protein n=1 Tax=Paenibacillus hemerocallicola TaxID=1172614 RepID=A0A5C4TFI4_9BACL|nr:hypothetical protein [Paenibacillus hemerocallicola]TNJ67552.1 hypothetical protein FE784_04000 [Paenibacillus hemerocallicola]